jgi:hypothetical protein
MGRENLSVIPSRGDRIELFRTGVTLRGQVWYADQLQILVKWDDGTSGSLRIGHESFRITDRSKVEGNGLRHGLDRRKRRAAAI